jgi:hypothetical protein
MLIATGASESYDGGTNLDEFSQIINNSTQRIEIIKNNFDTLLNKVYDKMIDSDKNYVYVLNERFYKQIEFIPDYVDLYTMTVEIDTQTQSLIKPTKDSDTIIQICQEHEEIFGEYLDIQKMLINLYNE